MRIFMMPQVNDKEKIIYSFLGEVITAIIGEMSDTFDFTEFSNGKLDIRSIETILPYRPISNAERVDGVLSVTLLNFIGMDASESERFPDWVEV